MTTEVPRYEITHGDVTVEAVVIQVDGKTIVQPVEPVVVLAGESFTISGGARTVTLDWGTDADADADQEGAADERTPAERQHDMTLFGPCFACRAEHPGRPPVARMTVTRLLPGNGGVQRILTCPEGHGND